MFNMISRYNGVCTCGAKVRKGQQIFYNRNSRRVESCETCKRKQAEPDLGRMFDMAYEDQCRDMCGL